MFTKVELYKIKGRLYSKMKKLLYIDKILSYILCIIVIVYIKNLYINTSIMACIKYLIYILIILVISKRIKIMLKYKPLKFPKRVWVGVIYLIILKNILILIMIFNSFNKFIYDIIDIYLLLSIIILLLSILTYSYISENFIISMWNGKFKISSIESYYVDKGYFGEKLCIKLYNRSQKNISISTEEYNRFKNEF